VNFDSMDALVPENIDPAHYFEEQIRLSKLVDKNAALSSVKYVAGADVAYDEAGNWMVGAMVVLEASTLKVVEQAYHEMAISFPYIPGLFSFREIPPLLSTYEKLSVKPDLIVCDGHGIAHPKGFGMASHLGVTLDVPTIGCAKKRLIGTFNPPDATRGSQAGLHSEGEEIGRVLRTQDGVKPLFISVGHLITIRESCDWIIRLSPNYRLPETTRLADQLANKIRNGYLET
jgi:deoxyribonuclease V